MKNFGEQWKVLMTRKEADDPEIPKITKALPVMKWVENVRDHHDSHIRTRNITLACVVDPEVGVPGKAPQLQSNQQFSTLHRSIEYDLVYRASHSHGVHPDDNALAC